MSFPAKTMVLLLCCWASSHVGAWGHRHPQRQPGKNHCSKIVRKTKCGLGLGILKCKSLFSATYFSEIEWTCCGGWTGQNCLTPVCYGNEAGAGMCLGGGKCIQPNVCLCPKGNLALDCSDVDECSGEYPPCSHECVNTFGSFECFCNHGYKLTEDGRNCTDILECEEDNGGCEGNYVEIEGSFNCTCENGYNLLEDQKSCEDIDECSSSETNGCAHQCINIPGSYQCACSEGFELQDDGVSCNPICDFDNITGCPNGGYCSSPYICNCTTGFLPPDCHDINECDGDPCHQECENTLGSFACACFHGYQLTEDAKTCTDVLECEIDNGGCESICIETEGSYYCDCEMGYGLLDDNKSCRARCHLDWPLGTCPNGGSCTSPGYCACPPGFQRPNCKNINECMLQNGGCSHVCTDTDGSFYCSCQQGFLLVNGNLCVDIDECSDTNHGCGGICVNQPGSFLCTCQTGFSLMKENNTCIDIDECISGTSDCSHGCLNTIGSYGCFCEKGYDLATDDHTCVEMSLCETTSDTACWPLCKPSLGGICECEKGFRPYEDGKHCYDPCYISPCLHGGVCKAGWNDVLSCDCSSTGFTGEFCDEGHVQIPSSVDLSVGKASSAVVVEANSAKETLIKMRSDPEIQISPNPIILPPPRSSVNLTITASKVGRFKVYFNISNPELSKDPHVMSIRAQDVFVKHRLERGIVPVGCFYLTVTCANRKYTFSSTQPWFRLSGEKRVFLTSGVAHFIYEKTSLPLGLDGTKVTYGTLLHVDDLVEDFPKVDKVLHNDPRSEGCVEIRFSPIEKAHLRQTNSLHKGLLYGVKAYTPYWFKLFMNNTNNSTYYKSALLTGEQVKGHKVCRFALTEPTVTYAVFWMTTGLIKRMLGQEFYLPNTAEDSPHCLVVDFYETMTLAINVGSTASNILEGIPFADEITKEYGVVVYPTTFGIYSGWNMRESFGTRATLFNGAGMFDYVVPDKIQIHAAIRAVRKMKHDTGDDFELATTSNLFLNRETHNLLSHFHTRAIDVFVKFNSMTLTLRFNIFGKEMTVVFENILEADKAVIGSGGNGERTICGPQANPPGVFAQANIKLVYLPTIAPITSFFLSSNSETFFFLTFDTKKDAVRGFTIEIIEGLLRVAIRRITMYRTFISKETLKVNVTWKRLLLQDIAKDLDEMKELVQDFNATSVTSLMLADLVFNLSTIVEDMLDKAKLFESRAHVSLDPLVQSTLTTMTKLQKLVSGSVRALWWEMWEGSVPYYPKEDVVGYMVDMKLTILGLSLVIHGELVLSTEDLMACSDLYEYYDHIQGGNSIRFSGIVTVTQTVLLNTKDASIRMLWFYFNADLGAGFEIAFSKSKPLFTLRLQGIWEIFGVRVTGNLFITNNEIVSILQVNIWNIFRVRLSIGGNVPRKVEDINLFVKGEFLPGGDNSLNESFFSALRQTIKNLAESTSRRMDNGIRNIGKAKKRLTRAQEAIEREKNNLHLKQADFDRAVQKLERAKEKLEKAKIPFKKAQASLTRAQQKLDSLCQIRDCESLCRSAAVQKECQNKKRSVCKDVKPCGFTLSKIGCVLKNAGCRIIRGLAYAGLAVAKGLVQIPIIVLDIAKAAVSAAQVIVDKSRFLLDVAKGLYSVAQGALEVAKATLSISAKVIDFLKNSLNTIFSWMDSIVENYLQKFFDIRKCGFKLELSVRNWFEIAAYCELNLLSRGWKMYSFSLNFKDIFGSMFGMTKSVVDQAKKMTEKSRRKREAIFLEEEYEFFELNDTLGSETWFSRCETFSAIHRYLNTSVRMLREVSQQIIKDATELENNTAMEEYTAFQNESLSIDELEIDFTVALEDFHMTKTDMELVLLQGNISQDEHILSVLDFAEVTRVHNNGVVESLKNTKIITEWEAEMEDVDFIGDCMSPKDCVSWGFGEIKRLLETIDPKYLIVVDLRKDLVDLENNLFDILNNDSQAASQTENLFINDSVLLRLSDVFCEEEPEVLVRPQNVTILEGESVDLTCKAKSKSSPVYYWLKNGQIISYGHDRTVFSLPNLTLPDEGSYECLVGNHVGNTSAGIVHITVVSAPQIRKQLPTKVNLDISDETFVAGDVLAKPTAELWWDCCSSDSCFQLKDILKPLSNGQFLCRYTATNEYGMVVSSESLVALHETIPSCPHVTIDLAFVIYGVNGSFSQSSFVNGSLSLESEFSAALKQLFWENRLMVELESLSLDLDSHLVSLIINPLCDDSDVASANNTKALDMFNHRLDASIKILQNLIENEQLLFTKYGIDFLLNTAYFHLRKKFYTCAAGFTLREDKSCVSEAMEFQLPPPANIQTSQDETYMSIHWKAPHYARHFAKGYTVTIQPDSIVDDNVLNISSKDTKLDVPTSYCGQKCRVTVTAFTEKHVSKQCYVEVDLRNKRTGTNSNGNLGELIGLPLSCVLAGLLVYCGLSKWLKRRSRKLTSLSGKETDSIEKTVSETRPKTKRKNIFVNGWLPPRGEQLQIYDISSEFQTPKVVSSSDIARGKSRSPDDLKKSKTLNDIDRCRSKHAWTS